MEDTCLPGVWYDISVATGIGNRNSLRHGDTMKKGKVTLSIQLQTGYDIFPGQP